MSWMPATKLSQLKNIGRETTTIDGQKILLIWNEEKVHAIQSQCPHMKLPLAKGKIDKDCNITCPFHKSSFNLNTGDAQCWSTFPPVLGPLLGKISKEKNLRIYPTKIEEDQILVDIS